jgi:hypothetical protein
MYPPSGDLSVKIRVVPTVLRILLLSTLSTLVGSISLGQVVFKTPQPGDVYKEIVRWVDNGTNDWRVTDPNATHPNAAPFLVNPTIFFTIDDLTDAIRAEAVITLWGGHEGTSNKTVAFNGNAPISIPELGAPNGIVSGSGQCYVSQAMSGIDVPLSHLHTGSNYFRGNSGGQICYDMGWGQWGIYALIIRVYYDPVKKPHATGTIASPSTGGTIGESPLVSASVSGSVSRVDFLAYYDGYDTDGDGIYQEYHHDYHHGISEGSTSIRNHVGTAKGAPWQVTWNTDWVPDQTPGSVKMVARILDNNGVWYVTPEATGISLVRSGSSVKLYKPEGVPQAFHVQSFFGSTKSSRITVPAGDNLAIATGALFHLRTWNGINQAAVEPGLDQHYARVNSWTAPEASYGVGHFFSYDKVSMPVSALLNGTNTIEFFANTQAHHGIEILWPGPAVTVRFSGPSTPASPTITTEPTGQTVIVGQTATFVVAASGYPAPSYQWQKNGTDIPGANGASYTTPATAKADSGSGFRCIVSNTAGEDTSITAILRVLTAPPIVNILANGSFESGTAPWTFFTNGSGSLAIVSPGTEGASAAKVSITAPGTNVQMHQTGFALEANTKYTLKFDAYANANRNITVSLFQNVSPYANYGLNAQSFTLGTTWQNFSITFTTSGFSGTVTDTRFMFWLANEDAAGDQYYFDNVILGKGDGTPPVPPTITQEPTSQTVQEGQKATFSVVASGTAPLAYQWQKDLINISGATAASYMTPATVKADSGASFRCIVSNTAGADTSMSVVLNVTPAVGPTINVWYGPDQTFAKNGTPQRWVNLLGNVSTPNGVDSLFYTLNGGARVPLSIGPDSRRLADSGDFNIDLSFSQLLGSAAPNTVVITAKDKLGIAATATVTVRKPAASSTSLPYVVSWSSSNSLGDSSQVVDGRWGVGGGTLQILKRGYDRLIALGDTSLTDYEVSVRMTIHGIDSSANAFSEINAGPGVGFIFRWTGHTDNPFTGQPKPGYLPLGAIGWARWLSVSNQVWEIIGNNVVTKGSSPTPVVQFGVAYYLKMRVETVPGQGGLYKLKVWKTVDPEPAGWLLSAQETLSDPQRGSILLVAHNTSVAFGPVTITSLLAPPTVTQEPVAQTVQVGQTATFSVTAIGASPLSYRWQKNGVDISGGLGSSYTTPATTQADNGSAFRCIVSNPAGADTSVAAALSLSTTVNIAYATGWNLLSVPLLAAAMDVSAVFPTATSTAYSYDAGGYTSTTTLANSRGYWLKFGAPVNQPISGAMLSSRDVAVVGGWNIIGPFESDVPLASLTTTPAGVIASQVWGYTSGAYLEASTLHPGQGYWVKATAPGILHLSTTAAKQGQSVASHNIDPEWSRLRFEDHRGHVANLYLAPDGTDNSRFELPPIPPSGIFDVRYVSGGRVETFGDGSHDLRLQDIEPPFTVTASNLHTAALELHDAVNGEFVRAILQEGASVTISHKLERLVLRETGAQEAIPTEFALAQNYPNPFNPTTNIRFDLPEPSVVTLKVFTMLGQEVATLAGGAQGAGSCNVTWDGKNSSGLMMGSGIYVYRIVAVGASGKDFTSTKRMALVK